MRAPQGRSPEEARAIPKKLKPHAGDAHPVLTEEACAVPATRAAPNPELINQLITYLKMKVNTQPPAKPMDALSFAKGRALHAMNTCSSFLEFVRYYHKEGLEF